LREQIPHNYSKIYPFDGYICPETFISEFNELELIFTALPVEYGRGFMASYQGTFKEFFFLYYTQYAV